MRFAEEARVKNSVWSSQIHDIEDIQCPGYERETESAGDGRIKLDLSLPAAQTATIDASTLLATASTRRAFDSRSDPYHLADTHMKHDIGRSGTNVVRNDFFSLSCRIGVQTSVRRRQNASFSAGAIGRASVELVIAG